jgi:hypothetical protein
MNVVTSFVAIPQGCTVARSPSSRRHRVSPEVDDLPGELRTTALGDESSHLNALVNEGGDYR